MFCRIALFRLGRGKDYKREMMVMVINVANCSLGSECLVVVFFFFIVTGRLVGDDPELNGLLAAGRQ